MSPRHTPTKPVAPARRRRRRPEHLTPGIGAVLFMVVVLVLAHGVPGFAHESPSRAYMDKQLAQRLHDDAIVTIPAPTFEDPVLEQQAARVTASTGGAARRNVPYVRDYRAAARRAAQKAHIRHPWMFVRQMAAESGYQPCARSGAGAVGIAQIMPGTARSWHVDPYDPDAALLVAARKMATYERQYGSYRLALAAYNAGPGAVAAAGRRVPAYPETRAYVHRVMDRSYPLAGMRQVYRLPGSMQIGFSSRLRALQRDVRRHGGRLRITEGWRSYDDASRIWHLAKQQHHGWQGAVAWAAPPGCSNHTRGQAADLRGSLGLAHRLAARHGLVFPMAREPWHIERAGIATQSG